jgi:tetratricopeptide (TPR) repeat protein
MTWLVALTLLSPPGGDFWLRTLARSAEVERWKLEGDQRIAMGTAEHNAEAEQAYAEAVRLSPRDPRAHYDHALALAKLGRYLDQVAELLATRALDQHFEAAGVALDLGIARARLGHYLESALEYRRAIDLHEGLTVKHIGLAHWNLGDCEMALGHLDEATRQYEIARGLMSTLSGADASDLPAIDLALGVAYDRAEDEARVRTAIRRANAGNVLAVLTRADSQIFFVPPEDREYSLALAYEGTGDRISALERWQEYLVAAPSGIWSSRARTHIDALLAAPAAASAPPDLLRCVAGKKVVAEVRTRGKGQAPVVRVFPRDADSATCLVGAAAKLTTSQKYELVGSK